MTRIERAARAALEFADALRDALPEVEEPEDKAYLVRLTAALARAQGWLEVLVERVRSKSCS
jgi:hypothetical protein